MTVQRETDDSVRAEGLRRWLIAVLIRSLGRRLPFEPPAPPPIDPQMLSTIADELMAVLLPGDPAQTGARRDRLNDYIAALPRRRMFRPIAGELQAVIEDLSLLTLWHGLEASEFAFAHPGEDAATLAPLVRELQFAFPAARQGSRAAADRVRELLDEIDANLPEPGADADAPEPSAGTVQPFAAIDARLAGSDAQRVKIVERAKLIVGDELQLRCLGRGVPEALRLALEVGWGPMMAMRLVRHGRDSHSWLDGIALLEGLLDQFEGRGTDVRHGEALLRRLDRELRESGLADGRRQALLAPLEQLSRESEAHRQIEAMPAPTPVERQLLRQVAMPGAWFRLLTDTAGASANWLQVLSHDVTAGIVEFASFDGRATVTVDIAQLLADLRKRRTEPLEPSAAAREALKRLIDER